MMRSALCLAVVLTVAAAGSAWSHPHPPLVVKINPDNRAELLQLTLETEQTTVLYRVSEGRISEVRVSPYYSRVALLVTSTSPLLPVNRLIVIDAAGNVLRTVDEDVRRFAFSPNGRQLACIAGPFYAGGIGFRPERTFIVDIDGTGEAQEIGGLEKAHDLHWLTNPSENSVYFRVLREGKDRVVRWDVRGQRLEETSLDGIRFSPDGKYLLRKPYETVEIGDCEPGTTGDSCLRITERGSGRELPSLAQQKATAHGWVYNRGHHLLFIERNPQTATVTEQKGDKALQAELITGYLPAEGLVFEVGSGKPPVPVVGIIGGEGSAGEWVTGDRGVIVISSEPNAGKPDGEIVVCEQLPCDQEAGARAKLEAVEASLPAPSTGQLQPPADAEFQYANPRFRWAPVEGAAWYRLDVCADAECVESIAGSERIEGTQWRSSPLPVGELFWRLAGVRDPATGKPTVGEFTRPARFFVRSDRVDMNPPVAVIETTSGPGGRVFKGSASLSAPTVGIVPRVEDDLSGVEWWRAEIDGLPVADSRQAPVSVLEGPWSDGVHRVDVTVEDRAGNAAAAAPARFSVDARPPRLILQVVTPDVVVSRRGPGADGSKLSGDDFDWFELTDRSELGVASVFFDQPGTRGARERGNGRRPLDFRSSWPELVLAVRGEWPFGSDLQAEAEGRRLLWLAAVDDSSGVASLELRTVAAPSPSGEVQVLEITATDLLGNVSSPLTLRLSP